MAADDDMKAMEEVVQLLETEPSNGPSSLSQPDIPTLREELAILVSTGKSKESIGVQLTQVGVKKLPPKDVEKYYKRYETFLVPRLPKPLSIALSRFTPG